MLGRRLVEGPIDQNDLIINQRKDKVSRILTYLAFQLIGPFLRQLITEHVLTRSIPFLVWTYFRE